MKKASKSLKEAKDQLRKNKPAFFDKRKEATKKVLKNTNNKNTGYKILYTTKNNVFIL